MKKSTYSVVLSDRVDAERGFQGIQSGEGIFSQCYGQHDTSK